MPIKNSWGFVLAGSLIVLSGTFLLSQDQGTTAKKLRVQPIGYVNPTDGRQMYKDYCAACHGMKGKGDGPAVEFLKAPPPDLATLTQRNQGKYPALKVKATLQFGPGSSHAHGTIDMPIWGRLFKVQGKEPKDPNDATADMRLSNLTAYVESLQQK